MKTIKAIILIIGIFSSSCLFAQNEQVVDKLLKRYRVVNLNSETQEKYETRKQFLYDKANSAKNKKELKFALRYLTPLINRDLLHHYPDGEYYHRVRLYNRIDIVLPILFTTDEKVRVDKDFSGLIPTGAEILEINGHSINDLRELFLYSLNVDKVEKEYGFKLWSNFSNFLFMEGIGAPYKAPYKLSYAIEGESHIVEIKGMMRKNLNKRYKLYEKQSRKDRAALRK